MSKVCLITGITGQDGSYLAESLLLKGYEVHGLKRRSSSINTTRIDHIYKHPPSLINGIQLHHGDMTDSISLANLLEKVQPDEIYNLAAQSHVAVSFEQPEYTAQVDGIGVLRLLETSKLIGKSNLRIYQASTSELFGNSTDAIQNEETPLQPVSPYGVAKLYAYWLSKSYRDSYSMYVSNGILFNHESPRRGETFVTRKITRAVAAIVQGKQDKLYLGNLKSIRDWGYAKEYVESMWLMLQQESPDDFVIATGIGATIEDFCRTAFSYVDLDWEKYVVQDERYFRRTEVDALIGDPSKAKQLLGWEAKTLWPELAKLMVEADLKSQSQ